MATSTTGVPSLVADRYAIERELGRGGMATVYLATDRSHGRLVALKRVRPEIAAALGADRFVREIRIGGSLLHPNIVPLLDSGDSDGPFFVMPFVDGETLRARLRREGQLTIEDAVQIARDVADALVYAHAHGIVHRDIKPENILLEGGRAVVADFGIARAIDVAGDERRTSSGIAFGTRAYMSPEQALGAERVDGRSDVYSLGCVLYEMLAGMPPFVAPTAQALTAQHINDTPVALQVMRPLVPSGLAHAVAVALSKLPADRPQAADLRRVLSATDSGSITPWSVPVQRTPGSNTATTPSDVAAIVTARRRVRGIAIGVSLLIAAALALVARSFGIFDGGPRGATSALVLVRLEKDAPPDLSASATSAERVVAGALELFPNVRVGGGKGAASAQPRYIARIVLAPRDSGVSVTLDLLDAATSARLSRGMTTAARAGVDQSLDRLALPMLRAIAQHEKWTTSPIGHAIGGTQSAAALRHLMEGQRRFGNVDLDGAASEFQLAIEADSACALAYHRLSVTQIWKLDHAGALATATRGLAHVGGPQWGILLRAQRHVALRQSDSAIALFRRVTRDYPTNLDAALGLGEAVFDLGWFGGASRPEATQSLVQVLTIDPSFARVQQHLVDLAIDRRDSVAARHWLEQGRADDDVFRARSHVLRLVFGTARSRDSAFTALASSDRWMLSEVVATLMLTHAEARDIDSVAALLGTPGRPVPDRLRSAQYRLVTATALSRWQGAETAWRSVAADEDVDAWFAQAHFAGVATPTIGAAILERARAIVASARPDSVLRTIDEPASEALLLLVQHALLSPNADEARGLVPIAERAAHRASIVDPLPQEMRGTLAARLALASGDTLRAIRSLVDAIARMPDPYITYNPASSMAPQRLVLLRLLAQTRSDDRLAARLVSSFRDSPSLSDGLYSPLVRAEALRLGLSFGER